jgi:host factor-I protein
MPFRGPNPESNSRAGKTPPDDTHQEAAYLKMLGEQRRPVSVKLLDGSVVHGWIEYYDRRMVRLTREGQPNLFIFKHEIAYIAEDAEPHSNSGNLPGLNNGNSPSAAK